MDLSKPTGSRKDTKMDSSIFVGKTQPKRPNSLKGKSYRMDEKRRRI